MLHFFIVGHVIFFTRITFQGIPNIRKRFTEIEKYAEQKNIIVELLVTPSRFTNEEKQNSWIKSISLHKSSINIK